MYTGDRITGSQEIFVNRHSGELLIGRAALEDCIENSQGILAGTEEDTPTLKKAIAEADTFGFEGVHPKISHSVWRQPDHQSHAVWLAHYSPETDEPVRPGKTVLNLYNSFGVGPSASSLARAAGGSLMNLQMEIGFAGEYGLGGFNRMTKSQLEEYGKRYTRRLTEKEIEALFQMGNGPSLWLLRNRFGSALRYFERLGFPDTSDWDNNDCVEWGVKYTEANHGYLPTAGGVTILATEGRGPDTRFLIDKFKKWNFYKDEVEIAYIQYMESKELYVQGVSERLQQYALVRPALRHVLEVSKHQDSNVAGARAMVALELSTPRNSRELFYIVEAKNTGDFCERLRACNRHISPALIENVALEYRFFDILWQFDHHMRYLNLDGRIRRTKQSLKAGYP